MSHAAPSTRECLLNAAEALFVEKGFAATSLRSIAARADANLAATHYHFGSKQGLFTAVVHRRVTPINEARLANLDALESGDQPVTVESILRAFLQPLMNAENIENLPGLIGRIYSEPASVARPLLEQEFGEVVMRFNQALSRVLPDIPMEELRWRFHFVIGSMLQTLTLATPLGVTAGQESHREKLERLIHFATPGFHAAPQCAGEQP